MTNQITTRSQALSVGCNREYIEFEVDGWGWCRAQTLTERERREYDLGQLDAEGNLDMSKVPLAGPRLMAFMLVDEEDDQLFSVRDVPELANKDARIISAIVERLRIHCGMDEDTLEEQVGNYEETQGDDSQ